MDKETSYLEYCTEIKCYWENMWFIVSFTKVMEDFTTAKQTVYDSKYSTAVF